MSMLLWPKWVGLGCLGLALLTALLGALSCPQSWLLRAWSSYCAGLERQLRLLSLRTPARVIALGQLGIVLVVVTAELVIGVPGLCLWLVLIAAAPPLVLSRMRRRRVAKLEGQLHGFLAALANALRVTPSLPAALVTLAPVMSSPLREQLQLVTRELRVGSSLDDALAGLAERVGSRTFDSALTAILIGRRLGGNLPRILESSSAALREVARLEGVVQVRTSEARAQLWVLLLCPFVIVALLHAVSPGYFLPLQSLATGWMIAIGAGLLWVAALVLARTVLAVEP